MPSATELKSLVGPRILHPLNSPSCSFTVPFTPLDLESDHVAGADPETVLVWPLPRAVSMVVLHELLNPVAAASSCNSMFALAVA